MHGNIYKILLFTQVIAVSIISNEKVCAKINVKERHLRSWSQTFGPHCYHLELYATLVKLS